MASRVNVGPQTKGGQRKYKVAGAVPAPNVAPPTSTAMGIGQRKHSSDVRAAKKKKKKKVFGGVGILPVPESHGNVLRIW